MSPNAFCGSCLWFHTKFKCDTRVSHMIQKNHQLSEDEAKEELLGKGQCIYPTSQPSMNPTVSVQPTISTEPSISPTISIQPSVAPTASTQPSSTPTSSPSSQHSSQPSADPTTKPSSSPSEVLELDLDFRRYLNGEPSSISQDNGNDGSSSVASTILVVIALIAIVMFYLRRMKKANLSDPSPFRKCRLLIRSGMLVLILCRRLPTGMIVLILLVPASYSNIIIMHHMQTYTTSCTTIQGRAYNLAPEVGAIQIEDDVTQQYYFAASGYTYNQVFSTNISASSNRTHSITSPDSNQPPESDVWLLDPSSFVPETLNVIPQKINKIFFQKASGFPPASQMSEKLKEAHESWPKMNPGWQVRYFDLDQARTYLLRHFHPVFLRAFDCVSAFAGKSNLFRMALLYREGGFHSDWKQVCLQRNLLEGISNTTNFFAAYDMWESDDGSHHECVQNAFVGARPQHPIIATMLKMILTNIQTSHYGKKTLDTTGTCLFGRAIQASEQEYNHFSQIGARFINTDKRVGDSFHWKGKFIVKHKCAGCGNGQDWAGGNNYNHIYKTKTYYCEDAASLFRTTVNQN